MLNTTQQVNNTSGSGILFQSLSIGFKICPRCQIEKAATEFCHDRSRRDGLACWCRACNNSNTKEWGKNHSKEHNARGKAWREEHLAECKDREKKRHKEHPEEHKNRVKLYYMRHSEKVIGYAKRYIKDRRAVDPNFKIVGAIRSRIRLAIKNGQKAGHTIEDMGCSIDQLHYYFLLRYNPFLIWQDHGKTWVIDHVKPLEMFDLTNRDQFLQAVHYTNLQPLSPEENSRKGSLYNNMRQHHKNLGGS